MKKLKEKMFNLVMSFVDVHAKVISFIFILIVFARVAQIGLSGSGWISLIVAGIVWLILSIVLAGSGMLALEYVYPKKNGDTKAYSLGPGVIWIVLAIMSAGIDRVNDDEVVVIRGELIVESGFVFMNPFAQDAKFYDEDCYRTIGDFVYRVEFDKTSNQGVLKMLNEDSIPDSLFLDLANKQLNGLPCDLKKEGISMFKFGAKGSML